MRILERAGLEILPPMTAITAQASAKIDLRKVGKDIYELLTLDSESKSYSGMPISLDLLRAASTRNSLAKSASTLTEARSLAVRTAFLCHSHNDATLVRGLLNLFQEDGWRVYVDWQDPIMGEKPTRETAERIKLTIKGDGLFSLSRYPEFHLVAMVSLGKSDLRIKRKGVDQVLIIPTTARTGDWHGSDYLQLLSTLNEV
jgi:hypothetical protein